MSKSLRKLDPTSNPEDFIRHPLNHSKAKMMYTFCRSSRFVDRTQKGVPYYKVPGELSKRTTCMGYGKKTTFEDRRGFPPPNRYTLTSDFEEKGSGISFGMGRERVTNSSMFQKSISPGPGSYNPKLLHEDPSFTIRKKTRDSSLDQQMKVPGPGQYKLAELINKIGRYSVSKYQNAKGTIIGKAIDRTKTEPSPGPNKYFPKILNSKGEKSMEQTRTNKFGNSKRQGIYTLNDNPGPGQYEHYSEFIH